MATMLRQFGGLLTSWKQPVSRHNRNVTATPDKPLKGDAALPPPAIAKGSAAATTS
jgi:hypothetical protein